MEQLFSARLCGVLGIACAIMVGTADVYNRDATLIAARPCEDMMTRRRHFVF